MRLGRLRRVMPEEVSYCVLNQILWRNFAENNTVGAVYDWIGSLSKHPEFFILKFNRETAIHSQTVFSATFEMEETSIDDINDPPLSSIWPAITAPDESLTLRIN